MKHKRMQTALAGAGALAAGLGAVITVDPEGVTIRPKEENR